jgi:hypothetical protein
MPDAEPRKRHCGRWVTGQRPTEVEWLAMHSMNDNERMTNEKIEGECVGEEVRDMRRLGGSTSTRSVLREEKAIHSNPYSTAMRQASLGFPLSEACCLRPEGDEKSSSHAGQECALSVERGDLRGVL